MTRTHPRTRNILRWSLIALATTLQAVQLRTGTAVSVSAWAAGLATPAALLQGVGLAGQSRRPILGAGAISVGYLIQTMAIGIVPPYVGWVAIALGVSGIKPPRRTAKMLAVAAIATSQALGVLLAALIHGDAGAAAPTLLLIEAVIVLGAGLAWTRRARSQALDRAAEAARGRLLAEERLRIARELHDLVGHGLATIAVQSGTARMALDAGSPADARAAVTAIESGSRDALREMRQVLGLLRNDGVEDDRSTAPSLRDLPDLLERVRNTGIDVRDDLPPLAGEDIPDGVQLVAYRIVQESLTNVVRHARRSTATVTVRPDQGCLHVHVVDTGASPLEDDDQPSEVPRGSGVGIKGMNERTVALGGQLEAGPSSGGPGWEVSALLPLVQIRNIGDPVPGTPMQTDSEL